MIVTNSGQGGQLPSVEDRGQELNGSSYPSLGNGPHAPGLKVSPCDYLWGCHSAIACG